MLIIKNIPVLRLSELYFKIHYGFSFIEQMMYLTTPHSVTSLGDGRFVVSFMTYFGFLLVDCNNRTVKYHILEEDTKNSMMGNHTWYDSCSGELYYTTYSLNDSMNKCINPDYPVNCRIMKYKIENGSIDEVWSGLFSDYLHDINIDANKNIAWYVNLVCMKGKIIVCAPLTFLL